MPFNWKKRFHLSTFENAHYFQQLFKYELTQNDKGFCLDCCCRCYCCYCCCCRCCFVFTFLFAPPGSRVLSNIIFRVFSINSYTWYTWNDMNYNRLLASQRARARQCLRVLDIHGIGEIITCISLSAIAITIYRKL